MKKQIILWVSVLAMAVQTSYAQKEIQDSTNRRFFIGSTLFNQVIKGRVIDADTKISLLGATISLLNFETPKGCISDNEGFFKLVDVPVGRCGIRVSYIGYHSKSIENLMLKSGKELILFVELQEKSESLDEIIIKAYNGKESALNEMAMISARSFNVEETEKYAGSWGDPSRMATNYAGVFVGNDQGNDIIIRGNSPSGLIWYLEGIPIPSPNHWDVLGATGGPVSMVNNNLLSRSDFFTSAFPAEYANGLSGVFDLKLRNGNYEKREYLAQIGFNGYELGAEGPFVKGSKASYLIHYRHSMLGLVDQLLWVDGLPYYKDLTVKVFFPYKNGNISVFALGGTSKITFSDTVMSKDGVEHEFQFPNGSKTGIVGLNHTHFINSKTRIKTSIGITTRRPFSAMDSVSDRKAVKNYYTDTEVENKNVFKTKLISKFNSKNIVDLGISIQNYSLEIFHEDLDYNRENDSVMYYDPYKVKEKNMLLILGFATKEQLPFKSFGMNRAYYFLLVITHFIFEAYKQDVTHDVVPIMVYPNTFRRKLIDFAAKITSRSRYIILNVTRTIHETINIIDLWERCQCPPKIQYE